MGSKALRSLLRASLPIAALVCGCGGESDAIPVEEGVCTGYPPASTSEYVLPYPVGTSRFVSQGNCFGSHVGERQRYSYDFQMPFGSEVIASRGGVVIEVRERWNDAVDLANGQANEVRIEHDDGTVANYAHLRHEGVIPEVGDRVSRGDLIAYVGWTGTRAPPHLHLVLRESRRDLVSLPLTFANASAGELEQGFFYEALAREPGG